MTRELLNEHNDCSVRAIVEACGVEYVDAWMALAATGRKHRRGVHNHHLERALTSLGISFRRFHPHRATMNFWAVARPGVVYIVHVKRHFTVYRDGSFYDWVNAEIMKCLTAWEVVR